MMIDRDLADVNFDSIKSIGDYKIYRNPLDGWYYLVYKEYVVCKSDLSVCNLRLERELENDKSGSKGKVSNRKRRTRKNGGQAVYRSGN